MEGGPPCPPGRVQKSSSWDVTRTAQRPSLQPGTQQSLSRPMEARALSRPFMPGFCKRLTQDATRGRPPCPGRVRRSAALPFRGGSFGGMCWCFRWFLPAADRIAWKSQSQWPERTQHVTFSGRLRLAHWVKASPSEHGFVWRSARLYAVPAPRRLLVRARTQTGGRQAEVVPPARQKARPCRRRWGPGLRPGRSCGGPREPHRVSRHDGVCQRWIETSVRADLSAASAHSDRTVWIGATKCVPGSGFLEGDEQSLQSDEGVPHA